MKLCIIPILIFFHFNLFSQTDCDTIVKKVDFKKLIYLINQCDEEVTEYQKRIKVLESTLTYQQKRIQFLEELIINRERFKIEKCPRLSKKSKRKKYRTA